MIARALVFLLAALPGAAVAQSYFSGTVRDTHGAGIAGVTVSAGHVANGGIGFYFATDGQAVTDALGGYAINTLAQGRTTQYVMTAQAPGFVFTIYPNHQCFDPSCVVVTSNQTVPAYSTVDFSVTRAATIAGNVTRADTGAPYDQVYIGVYIAGGGGAQASVAADGHYQVDGLLPGSYTAEATVNRSDSPLLSQRFALQDLDATRDPPAAVVTLQEGDVVGTVDFALHRGASIAGLLTSTLDGAPVPANVSVRRIGDFAYPGYYADIASGVGSYQSSTYASGLLAAGTFYVQFGRNDDYLPLFYPQVSSEGQAQQITLAAGQAMIGVDGQLTPVRTLAGSVTDAATHLPLVGVSIHTGTQLGSFFLLSDVSDATTDVAGHYVLQGLDSGPNYFVWADGRQGYVYQFYSNALPCCQFPHDAGATARPLGANEQATGVDFALQPGAFASGRVYDAGTGGGGGGAIVNVIATSGVIASPLTPYGFPDSPATDAQGNYVSGAVAIGNYYLTAQVGARTYMYPGIACAQFAPCDFAQAPLLSFTSAGEYTHLDFVIAGLDRVFQGNFE